jgi:O-succinylbenzoic acid--CoA ligase
MEVTYWQTNASIIKEQEAPEHPYFKKAYALMCQWLDGQETFTMQTSGSTGTPQQIVLSRAQLSSSARMTAEYFDLKQGSKVLVCLNIEYIGGFMMLVRGMEFGWDLTIIEPSSNPLLNLHVERHFDFISMVPMQLIHSIGHKDTLPELEATGKILLGGAPVGEDLIHHLQSLPLPVYQSYGMTETVSHIALRLLNQSDSVNAYTVLPGVDFGVDVRGCLWVTGAVTNHLKVQTNDLVEQLNDHQFEWVGRFDNIINSGGVKISLDKMDREISGVFHEESWENAFFCWYEPDAVLGQKLVVFVEIPDSNLDVDSVFSKIRNRVRGIESPKHVYFVKFFSRTPSDKIDKRLTSDLYFKSING